MNRRTNKKDGITGERDCEEDIQVWHSNRFQADQRRKKNKKKTKKWGHKTQQNETKKKMISPQKK